MAIAGLFDRLRRAAGDTGGADSAQNAAPDPSVKNNVQKAADSLMDMVTQGGETDLATGTSAPGKSNMEKVGNQIMEQLKKLPSMYSIITDCIMKICFHSLFSYTNLPERSTQVLFMKYKVKPQQIQSVLVFCLKLTRTVIFYLFFKFGRTIKFQMN